MLGMTVAQLREQMSNDEYQDWCAFLTYEAAVANMQEVK